MSASSNSTTIQISEIDTPGLLKKPLTFKVLYKFPKPEINTPSGRKSNFKFIIGDESACILLLCSTANQNGEKIYQQLKLNRYYSISVGGLHVAKLKSDYEYLRITSHPMELWVQKSKKDQIEEENNCSFAVNTPLVFNFIALNKLSPSASVQNDSNRMTQDIIGKVFWKSSSINPCREILLEDDSRKGKNKAMRCKLWGDHKKAVTRKGLAVIIKNPQIKLDKNELVINVSDDRSAIFVISSEDDLWMLTEAQKNEHKNTCIIRKLKRDSTDLNESINVSEDEDNEELAVADSSPSSHLPSSTKRQRTQSETQSPKKSPLSRNSNGNARSETSVSSISEVKKQISGKRQLPLKCTLKSIFISGFKLRRYLGCGSCSKALKTNNGKYFCDGVKCKKQSKDKEPQRKIYFVLNNITLLESPESDEGVEKVVCFNHPIQEYMGKSAEEFGTDIEADEYFRNLVNNRTFDVEINARRKGQAGPDFCKSPWEIVIEKLSSGGETTSVSDGIENAPTAENETQSPAVYSDAYTIPESAEDNIRMISQILAKREVLDVKVTKSSTWNTSSEDQYQMKSNPRGIAIHINILQGRRGAEEDVRVFEALFEQLYYKVISIIDLTLPELKLKIEECQKVCNEENYDSLVLCISGHGINNNLKLADGLIVNIWTDLIYKFDDNNFPRFRGKPKVVFINTCQSFKNFPEDYELLVPSFMPSSTPNNPDFLVMAANSPGFNADRCVQSGTHFMRTLAAVIMNHAHNTEIKKLFMMVAKIMARPVESEDSTKPPAKPHLPEIRDFLFSKDFYFNPGL